MLLFDLFVSVAYERKHNVKELLKLVNSLIFVKMHRLRFIFNFTKNIILYNKDKTKAA